MKTFVNSVTHWDMVFATAIFGLNGRKLLSFENYNTTLFAIGFKQTLPIYIGTQLRAFISPAMNALSVFFITLTSVGTVFYELTRTHQNVVRRRKKGKKMEINPCLSCSGKDRCKNNPTCLHCEKRLEYVNRLEKNLKFTCSYGDSDAEAVIPVLSRGASWDS